MAKGLALGEPRQKKDKKQADQQIIVSWFPAMIFRSDFV